MQRIEASHNNAQMLNRPGMQVGKQEKIWQVRKASECKNAGGYPGESPVTIAVRQDIRNGNVFSRKLYVRNAERKDT